MNSVDDGVASRGTFVQFLAYVIAFHLLWIAWPLAVYPRLLSLGDTTLEYAMVSIGCRLLVWVVPVLLYLAFNAGHPAAHGWGTAMSTDTARRSKSAAVRL